MSLYCSECGEDAWFAEGCEAGCGVVLCDDCQQVNEGYCQKCYTAELAP